MDIDRLIALDPSETGSGFPSGPQAPKGQAAPKMTAVFDFDLRQYQGNPHHADTPFGKPVILAIGDEFTAAQARAEQAEAEAARLREYYDAAEAIRDVGLLHMTAEMSARMKAARAALREGGNGTAQKGGE
jgi:hypothetical protein